MDNEQLIMKLGRRPTAVGRLGIEYKNPMGRFITMVTKQYSTMET